MDTINMCMFASRTPEGNVGGIVWDIFTPEDAGSLNTFCHVKPEDDDCGLAVAGYLDEQELTRLHSSQRVLPHRVVQKQGDCLIIPAGCVYQVRCRSDLWRLAGLSYVVLTPTDSQSFRLHQRSCLFSEPLQHHPAIARRHVTRRRS